MRILISGADGQLGSVLKERLQQRMKREGAEYDVYAYSKQAWDVTNQQETRQLFDEVKPDILFHLAAYTAVDQAETDQAKAYEVNAMGAKYAAQAAAEHHCKMCYVSTDYVFNGRAIRPYTEQDQTDPLSIYGDSKRAGEEWVTELSPMHYIVRTSWLYSAHGNNFLNTMLRLGKERDTLKVVNDQIGSPTYCVDLADCLMELVQSEHYGTYHVSNSGCCSWFEFAKAIFEEAQYSTVVEPCTTDEFPREANRPTFSVLENGFLAANGFPALRHWREGLRACLKEKNSGIKQQ